MVSRPVPGTPRAIVAAVLLLPVFLGLALVAFVWPNARLGPRDLPLGVAGPAAAQVANMLETADGVDGDPFEVHRYAGEVAARDAVERREIYGAVVTGPAGVTVLTASAASPAVAQQLAQAVREALAGGGQAAGPAQPTVVDVVAASAADQRGIALGSSILPLVLAGMAVGVALTSVSRPGAAQAGAIAVTAGLVGVVATAVTNSWLDVVGGSWWADAGVFALMILAIASAVAGLRALLDIPGIGLAAVTVVVLGNPWSGFTSAPELLPRWVSAVGGVLPPGAAGRLLRSVAFFDGNGALDPALVLLAWVVLGMAGMLVSSLCGSIGVPAQVAVPDLELDRGRATTGAAWRA